MKALRLSAQGFKIGDGLFGTHGKRTGTVREIVHDGDTLNIRLNKDLAVRYLGIDSAEVSFTLPGTSTFVHLTDSRWDEFFASGAWRNGIELHPGLLLDLDVRIGNGAGVAANHARHAKRAQLALEQIIRTDLGISGKTNEEFAFFMAFAHEFLDGTGRLLCYLNSSLENFSNPETRKAIARTSYNERQLASGAALPYFIWPNIQPFLAGKPFSRENIEPESFWRQVQRSSKLRQARESVASARANGMGVFDPADPLRVAPFELRFLSRKTRPDRFVIDLARPGNTQLLAPERYYTIPHPENRLFIPAEYTPIFRMYGWTETAA